MKNLQVSLKALSFVFLIIFNLSLFSSEPLGSWNDAEAKRKIIEFVQSVIKTNSESYVKPSDRIALFDNDGTVQLEKPFAFVDMFALVRIRNLALNDPEHLSKKYPEWKNDPLINKLVETSDDNLPELLEEMKYDELIKLFNLANTSDYQETIDSALHEYVYHYKHPRYKQPPAKLVYQPMVELIEYLKQNDFTVYFVSGSTTDYLRQFSESVGIDRNHVIGWNFNGEVKTDTNGKMFIYKTGPTVDPVSVKDGKAVNIQRVIGKFPAVAVGNSSGDIAMLTYARQNNPDSLCLVLDHNDAEREYSYDFGDAVRYDAEKQKWIVIDMKKDFKTIFKQ